MALAIMSVNDLGPRMGIFGPRICNDKWSLSATQMKYFSASIVVLDFFTHSVYNKDNLRCPQATPRRGGQASASARTGDFIVSVGR